MAWRLDTEVEADIACVPVGVTLQRKAAFRAATGRLPDQGDRRCGWDGRRWRPPSHPQAFRLGSGLDRDAGRIASRTRRASRGGLFP